MIMKSLLLLVLVSSGYTFAMESEHAPIQEQSTQKDSAELLSGQASKKAKFSGQQGTFEYVHSCEGCGTLFSQLPDLLGHEQFCDALKNKEKNHLGELQHAEITIPSMNGHKEENGTTPMELSYMPFNGASFTFPPVVVHSESADIDNADEELVSIKIIPTPEGSLFQCVPCDALCTQAEQIRAHLHEKHYKRKKFVYESAKNRYKCDQCNATFELPAQIRDHLLKHTKQARFSCEICDKDFKLKSELESHKNSHKKGESSPSVTTPVSTILPPHISPVTVPLSTVGTPHWQNFISVLGKEPEKVPEQPKHSTRAPTLAEKLAALRNSRELRVSTPAQALPNTSITQGIVLNNLKDLVKKEEPKVVSSPLLIRSVSAQGIVPEVDIAGYIDIKLAGAFINKAIELVQKSLGYKIPLDEINALLVKVYEALILQSIDGKIDKKLVDNMKSYIFQKMVFGATTATHSLPDVLGTLTKHYKAHTFYLQSVNQGDDWSCGYWAVFNALALNYLLEKGYAVTSDHLQTLTHDKVRKLISNVPKQSIDEAQLMALIHAQELKDVFILTFNQKNKNEQSLLACTYEGPYDEKEDSNPYSTVTFTQEQNEFTEIFALLRERIKQNDKARAYHFICNLEAYHWILISIVKRVDRGPIIIILDSAQFPVPHRGNEQYITFLYTTFIQPFYQQIQASIGEQKETV